ncbi:carbohydrate ABC transporter substrate-binding protein [Streptomyces luteolifulvus]|jgi:alpha-glucoside transport system substrate-binding protein|uniref:Carbohydrate ABC transporter substrate-binding protein n=1 Tax=Streptomyces luteolifulvus TaxID=2615112 RepID=A0A6H9UZB5_9ACTN|nr:ABC transporter substrate-binding protein [Streptomyces luteolifulvus]KAB1144719.1 carbohydrate ABC transporter substrate-binding protein [Streptomyces luteolifulvus]
MKRAAGAGITTAVLVATAVGCGSIDGLIPGGGGRELEGQTVTVAGVWTDAEQHNFQKVLDAFSAKTGAKVKFISTGDDFSKVVGSKIAGGNAPDVAMVPQVGVLLQFARKGWLMPLSLRVGTTVAAHYAPIWRSYGTVSRIYYGLYVKATDKSTVWYRTDAFARADVRPPKTFDEMVKVAKTVNESGLGGFAVGGRDGWTLTDWFENIYLSQAGPDKYDKLARHDVKWTDPTVVTALTTFGKLFTQDGVVAGGAGASLKTDFPTSVRRVFGDDPGASMVYEGDFVGAVVSGDLKKKVGEDAKMFHFPPVAGGKAPFVGGGDAAVVLRAGKNRKAAMKLVEYLATPEAATVWARQGGFLSPNRGVKPEAYHDPTTRALAAALIKAGDGVRFDMSDQAPAAFGGTAGAGEWKILQDFLLTPTDAEGTAKKLEDAASDAYRD